VELFAKRLELFENLFPAVMPMAISLLPSYRMICPGFEGDRQVGKYTNRRRETSGYPRRHDWRS